MKNIFDKMISTDNAIGLLPLRLAAGAILAAHGAQKLFEIAASR